MVVSNIFLLSPLFGEDEPIFDEHIFQVGWNHQLDNFLKKTRESHEAFGRYTTSRGLQNFGWRCGNLGLFFQAITRSRLLTIFHFYDYGRKGAFPKTNGLPLKIGRALKGNEKVFQPSIFRCELIVSERVYKLWVDDCQRPIFWGVVKGKFIESGFVMLLNCSWLEFGCNKRLTYVEVTFSQANHTTKCSPKPRFISSLVKLQHCSIHWSALGYGSWLERYAESKSKAQHFHTNWVPIKP